MASSSLLLLGRRLAQVSLKATAATATAATVTRTVTRSSSILSIASTWKPVSASASASAAAAASSKTIDFTAPQQQQIRTFAQKKPPKGADNKKQGSRNKNSTKSRISQAFNEQHKEWVAFQQTLQVKGHETGQVLDVKATAMTGSKTRGGKAVRKKREKELAPERARREQEKLMEASGGHFPPLRYADAETQRLLTESYANMPPRAGPRGTRHRKRMKNRIFDRNKAAAKQKFFKKRAHFAKMAKRSQVVADIQQVQSHAPVVCDKEQAYQQLVLERWAATILGKDIHEVDSSKKSHAES